MSTAVASAPVIDHSPSPRLGFLGVGWIGRNRMEAVARSGFGEVVGIADPSEEVRAAAGESVPEAGRFGGLDELLEVGLDGLVIATPSALHAEQSIRALESGVAVFCQKPLGRTAEEVRRVVDAARAADLLLGVDLSYRYTAALKAVREVVRAGEIGRVYAAEVVFHNAYGPDKPWFHDRALSGGGCVMDLGIHLVDSALWILDFPAVEGVTSRLFAGGEPLQPDTERVEDYATARLDLAGGGSVELACSWNLPAGQEAVISATFYGTGGGVRMRNLNGSFYDFTAERMDGTRTSTLVAPPDDWGGRAAVEWARRLGEGTRFDPEGERLIQVAGVLDRMYGR